MSELFDDDDDPDILVERPKSNGVLCFHNGTELAMILHVERFAENNAESVLASIDQFCYERCITF